MPLTLLSTIRLSFQQMSGQKSRQFCPFQLGLLVSIFSLLGEKDCNSQETSVKFPTIKRKGPERMRKKRLYLASGIGVVLLLSIIFSYLLSSVQKPYVLWEDHLGSSYYTRANAVAVTRDRIRPLLSNANRVYVVGKRGRFFTVRAYHAAGGFLQWQDPVFDGQHLSGEAFDVTVAGHRVFVVGQIGTSFSVRAYHESSGNIIWEDHFNRQGQLDKAVAVAVEGDKVFVVGRSSTTDGGYAFAVRAYDVATGILQWEDHDNQSGIFASAFAVAVRSNRVFVAGYSGSIIEQGPGSTFTVRVYDVGTGSLIWQDLVRGPDAGQDFNEALAVAVSDDTVFVVGKLSQIDCTNIVCTTFAVMAYDVAGDGSGQPSRRWIDSFSGEVVADEPGNINVAYDVVLSGDRVFVAGKTQTNAGGSAFTVRSYDAATGNLLWEDRYDRHGKRPDYASAITAYGNSVYVVGITNSSSGHDDFTLRIYDADGNGAGEPVLLAEDHVDGPDGQGSFSFDEANAVTLIPGFLGGRLFVVGSTGTIDGQAMATKAYNMRIPLLFVEEEE